MLKEQLYKACQAYVQQRINTAEQAIKTAREAANDDTKSSAGDKYETTREMMQQEIDRNTSQLNETLKLKHVLSQINPELTSKSVQPGSLVMTNNGLFYIAISVGSLKIDDQQYFSISATSPLGIKLMKQKVGAVFSFNGKDYKIEEVF